MKRDREEVGRFLDEVQKDPYFVLCTVVEGFAFHVYYDSQKYTFYGKMFFTPGWGHSHGLFGRTKDQFFDNMVLEIEDARKIFTEGGRLPEDYYDHK
jgi:hypothetical protein